ncbi:EamA family transporter RarD [Myxococcota bacterium]|nr:EamA family transporter RarD [Myxococcota bacterium]
MATNPSPSGRLSSSGVLLAVSCYVLWGIVPAYWKAIDTVAAHEVLVARILWTLVWMAGVVLLGGRTEELRGGEGRSLVWSLVAAMLLALNWGVFIYAVQIDQVLATSLGYYINPLMSVLLGMLFLGERLSRLQTISVAIATGGVVAMTIEAGELPWIALVLATSFALYGLIHKLRPQPALGGLVREMLVLSPFALLALGVLLARSDAALAKASLPTHLLVALAGPVTAIPLLLFHASTKRLPLVVVGMFQFIAPTLTFLLATLVYHEPFARDAAIGFGLVWLGLGTFLFDALLRLRTLDPR